jgi:hypothetical protein
LRQLADFTVRNGEWIRSYDQQRAGKEAWADVGLNPGFIESDASIWTVVHRRPESLVVQLVNFSGLDPRQRWDEAHAAPAPRSNVSLQIQTDRKPLQVHWDCPEAADGPQPLIFGYSNGILTFQIPHIHFTGLAAIHD